MQGALKMYNKIREKNLEKKKGKTQKRRRLQLKIDRKGEQEIRKKWSKRHGGDTYGDDSDSKVTKKHSKACKACGSNTHSRTTSRMCTFNKKSTANLTSKDQPTKTKEQPPKESDHSSNQSSSEESNQSSEESDQHSQSNYGDTSTYSSEEDNLSVDLDTFDDQVCCEDLCNCGSLRAHKANCPLNTRNLYTKRELFPKVPQSRSSIQVTFRQGAYVAVHTPSTTGKHLVCRVVQIDGSLYTLYSRSGRRKNRFSGSELKHCPKDNDIPLDKWRQSEVTSLSNIGEKDLTDCQCNLDDGDIDCHYIHVEDDNKSKKEKQDGGIHNDLYSLSNNDVATIQHPKGWLTDAVIAASQRLLLQNFPNIDGLQPPSLQQVGGFHASQNDFVQIINVEDTHWCVVSNIGCKDGDVNVYDTLYKSVRTSVIPIVATLTFTSLKKFTINMVDIQLQTNGYDCGVLAIAIAYDLCSGNDPRGAEYDPSKRV